MTQEFKITKITGVTVTDERGEQHMLHDPKGVTLDVTESGSILASTSMDHPKRESLLVAGGRWVSYRVFYET